MLAIATLFAPTQHASAAVADCTYFGGGGNYFDGMYAFSNTYVGVSSYITAQAENLCTSDTSRFTGPPAGNLGNFSYAWTMIADSAGNGWLQSGFFRSYGTPFEYFSQYYQASTGVFDVVAGYVAPGDTHNYWQQFYPDSQSTWHSNVDITRFINANPTGWAGYSQQFFNETRYLSSDVPGNSGAYTQFNNIQVENGYKQWGNPSVPFLTSDNDSVNYDGGRWASPWITSSISFEIWTP